MQLNKPKYERTEPMKSRISPVYRHWFVIRSLGGQGSTELRCGGVRNPVGPRASLSA